MSNLGFRSMLRPNGSGLIQKMNSGRGTWQIFIEETAGFLSCREIQPTLLIVLEVGFTVGVLYLITAPPEMKSF
jgi:hypothetical protein